MNKLSKDKRDRIILIAAASAIAAGAIWYLIIGGQNRALAELEDKNFKADSRLRRADQLVQRSNSIRSERESLESQVVAMESTMIPYRALRAKSWLLDTLTDFIRTNRLSVELVSLPEDALVGQQDAYLMLPDFPYLAAAYPNVTLRGTYHEFGKFLAGLENAFPFLSIQKLEISPPMAAASGADAATSDRALVQVHPENERMLKVSMTVTLLFRPPGAM